MDQKQPARGESAPEKVLRALYAARGGKVSARLIKSWGCLTQEALEWAVHKLRSEGVAICSERTPVGAMYSMDWVTAGEVLLALSERRRPLCESYFRSSSLASALSASVPAATLQASAQSLVDCWVLAPEPALGQ